MARLKILSVVSECVPFAKTGGLADVAGALPLSLAARGHDVRVVLPRYRVATKRPATQLPFALGVPIGYGKAWGSVWESPLGSDGARAYLLEQNELFDRAGIYGDDSGDFGDNLARFTFLSRGALELCGELDFVPDVVHVHDWQSSLVPIYLNSLYRHTPLGQAATVLTVHNMGYQGWFSKLDYWQTGLGWDQFNSRSVEAFDRVNLLKGGLYHATIVSTVSPRYAREIQTPEGGEKLDGVLRDRGGDVLGVLNGIDESVWNPETDRLIAEPYSAADLSGKAACKAALQQKMGLPVEARAPLVGLVSRFAHQKGIDVFAGALDRVLAAGAQVVVLGSGDAWAEQLFQELSTRTKLRCFIGMNETLAHEIEAGADLFTMPSRYEPCGLNQMYSQRYGTLPVVRAVGGLDDTVEHERTGFKFRELSADALGDALLRAIYVYRHEPLQFRAMQLRAMQKPLGWSHATRQYEALYRLAIAKRHGRLAASRASIMGR